MAYLDDVLTQENFRNQVDVVAQERSQRMDNVPYGTVFEKASCRSSSTPITRTATCRSATCSTWPRRRSTRSAPSTPATTCPTTRCSSIVGDVSARTAFAKAETLLRSHPGRVDAPKREIPAALPPVVDDRRLDLVEDVPCARDLVRVPAAGRRAGAP